MLQNEIQQSRQKGSSLEQEILQQNDKWNVMYEQTVEDLSQRIEDSNAQRSLNEIQNMVEHIKDKEKEIDQIQKEIQ